MLSARVSTPGNIFLALEPRELRETTWRCNNRRRPSLAYTPSVFFRKGKLRHAPAKTWRGLRIPLFSLVPLFIPRSLVPPTIPIASGGNENPEDVAYTASVCQPAGETVVGVSGHPSLFSSILPCSSTGHEFVQSESLIPWVVFAFIRMVNARDTGT